MINKKFFNLFIYGNKFNSICIAFTITTMVDLLLCVLLAEIYDISYAHLGTRFYILCIVVFSLHIFRFFENLSIFIILILHFFISILIMVSNVWLSSFFIELHPNAYRDAIRTIFIIYPIMIAFYLIGDFINTIKINRILKNNLNNK